MNKIRFILLSISILVFAVTLRIYHFPIRFGIGGDDARDNMVAQESIIRHHLPLSGSFSSAGPFVFGPLFYWIIIGSKVLFPNAIETPYVVTLFLSLVTVAVSFVIGYVTGGKRMAIIIGLLTASSPQLVLRSVVLGQHSYIALFGMLALLFFVLFYKKRRIIYSTALGIATGAAVSMHYQGLNLLLFAPMLLFLPLSLKRKVSALCTFLLGFFLTQLPLLYWDYQQQFANTRNMLDYILIAQYRLYIPNSWKLFFGNYLPSYWSYVSGGYPLGILGEILVGAGFIYLWIIKRLTHLSLLIFSMFFILLGINRYYRGERFEGYMIYLLPFILFCSSYTLSNLSKLPKGSFRNNLYDYLGLRPFVTDPYLKICTHYFGVRPKIITTAVLSLLVMGNIFYLVKILPIQNNHLKEYQEAVGTIASYYPNQKIAIYDYSWLNSDISYPISLLLSHANLGNRSGIPVGIHCKNCLSDLPLITVVSEHPVVALDRNSIRVRDSLWQNVNQESIYNDLISQWEQKHLSSTFSLSQFILWKLGLK